MVLLLVAGCGTMGPSTATGPAGSHVHHGMLAGVDVTVRRERLGAVASTPSTASQPTPR